ncbi:MAG TPA: type VI secretion system baseplate subunit TssG [Mucilaginibacter sp.]|nr:type VI secretion system baseplate subunit TssG [Mucilaginibacter sp.]
MEPKEIPHIFSNYMNNDFKAEVVAAEMVEQGFPVDQILILMIGALKRSYRKDVDAIDEEFSEYDHNNYRVIKTPKEGIYDMLPEGLFHSVSLHQSSTNHREIIDMMKFHKVQETNARRFFMPFETAINHLRVQMALYENRLDKRSHYSELSEVFSGNWDIFNYMDAVQANLFVQILPIIHDIRDDYPLTETVFELILMVPVKIVAARSKPVLLDNPVVSMLGDNGLGVDLTTGNVLFDDGDDEIAVNIGPISKAQLNLFTPGTKQSKIFESLCDHLLPVHVNVNTTFELLDADKACVLADGENTFNSTMGLSTYL